MATETDIQRFYRGKNIFLTGGTGFLGKAYIEKILRVTAVNCIYMLIRPKKNQDVQKRLDDLFKVPLFEELLRLKPEAKKRIIPIMGDCSEPNLGLSAESIATLVNNVHMVVHGAATVRFNEELKVAVAINVRGTMDVIKLAKMMPKLQSFVHISSAFSNCFRQSIDERFYDDELNVSADVICKIVDEVDPQIMTDLTVHFKGDFPNTYTFSKMLSEQAVRKYGKGLPIAICRPGIISSSYKEPARGWLDNLYGPNGFILGILLGIVRIVNLNKHLPTYIVPVDYCANLMGVIGWQTAMSASAPISPLSTPDTSRQQHDIQIYNFVPESTNIMCWGDYNNFGFIAYHKMPSTKVLWYPFSIIINQEILYGILNFFLHLVPGYFFDLLLAMFGKPRRLIKTYRKLADANKMLVPFVTSPWTFTMTNTKLLWDGLDAETQRLFEFDLPSMDWGAYATGSIAGMRLYLLKDSEETIPRGLRRLKLFAVLHWIVTAVIVGCIALALTCWLM